MQEVDAVLTAEGFRRSGQNFRKRLPEGKVRWSIEFQKSRHSTKDFVSFTFWIHAEWKHRPAWTEDWEPKTTWYGGAGDRIGNFLPRREDTWWDIDGDKSDSVLSEQMKSILRSHALPFLRQFETEKEIERHLRKAGESTEYKSNYPMSLTMLAFDIRDHRPVSEIEKRVERVRHLGRINGVSKDVVESTIQRIMAKSVTP
jgi:hypothetical protein